MATNLPSGARRRCIRAIEPKLGGDPVNAADTHQGRQSRPQECVLFRVVCVENVVHPFRSVLASATNPEGLFELFGEVLDPVPDRAPQRDRNR